MTLLYKTSLLVSLLMISHPLLAESGTQTCSDNIRPTAPDTRYTIQTNGDEVLDNQTQLVWKRCLEGSSGDNCEIGNPSFYTWEQALALADTTWRLPNIKELSSLIEYACESPAMNVTIFPNTNLPDVQKAYYIWSSSPTPTSSSSNVMAVHFRHGVTFPYSRGNYYHVRLVRDKQ